MSGDLCSSAKNKLFGPLHVELNQSYSIYALFPDYFVERTSDYFLRVYDHALWRRKREAVWTLLVVVESSCSILVRKCRAMGSNVDEVVQADVSPEHGEGLGARFKGDNTSGGTH
jgi:hypothetical protein